MRCGLGVGTSATYVLQICRFADFRIWHTSYSFVHEENSPLVGAGQSSTQRRICSDPWVAGSNPAGETTGRRDGALLSSTFSLPKRERKEKRENLLGFLINPVLGGTFRRGSHTHKNGGDCT